MITHASIIDLDGMGNKPLHYNRCAFRGMQKAREL